MAMTFEVEVEKEVLITPLLPFGQSYAVRVTMTNEYGTTVHESTGKNNELIDDDYFAHD